MTESEKALKNVLDMYKSKKIITQSKKITKENKKVIKEKDQIQKEAKKDEKVNPLELDDVQKSFISKYIEYTELNLLNQSSEQLTATFQKALGPNAQAAIKELKTKIDMRESKIKELAKELTAIKDQIVKETEKARAKATLISLAQGIPQEKPVGKDTEKPEDIEKNIIQNKK